MIFYKKLNFKLIMSDLNLLYCVLTYIIVCIILVLLKHLICGPDDTSENSENEKKPKVK